MKQIMQSPRYFYDNHQNHNMADIINFIYDLDYKAKVRYKVKTNHLEITDSICKNVLNLYPGEVLRFESKNNCYTFTSIKKDNPKEDDYV